MIEEMLAARGTIMSHRTVWQYEMGCGSGMTRWRRLRDRPADLGYAVDITPLAKPLI